MSGRIVTAVAVGAGVGIIGVPSGVWLDMDFFAPAFALGAVSGALTVTMINRRRTGTKE